MDLSKLKQLVNKAEELTKSEYKNSAAEKVNAKFNALEARKQDFLALKAKNQEEINTLEAQIRELSAKIPTAGDKARPLYDRLKSLENELEFLKYQSQNKFKPILAAEAQAIAESPEWLEAAKEYAQLIRDTENLIDEFVNMVGQMRNHLVTLHNTHPFAFSREKKELFTNGNNAY